MAQSIGDLQLPDHNPARPVSSFATPNQSSDESPVHAWDDKDGPSFSDILDVLNPLQHIPIVNTIYRHLTGDSEGAVADVAGGTLYGGFIGLALASIGLGVEDATGEDPGDTVYAALFGDDKADGATAVANNETTNPEEPVSEDDAPPPPSAAPREAVTTSDAGDASVKDGDYLVFGGSAASSTKPKATPITPVATPATTASASAPIATAKPSPKQSGSDSFASQQGDYLVFGGSTPGVAAPQTAQTPITSSVSSDVSPVQATLQQSGQKDGKLMPLPQRRSVTPPGSLPMPTTGPGALPGGKSQAKVWTGQPVGNDWFADAFNQNMDKYNSLHGANAYGAAAQTNAAAASAPVN